jgi:hypothetical protein
MTVSSRNRSAYGWHGEEQRSLPDLLDSRILCHDLYCALRRLVHLVDHKNRNHTVEAQREKLIETAAVAEKKEGEEEGEGMRIPGSSLREDLCRPSNE